MHSPKPPDQVDEQLDHMLTTQQVHHLQLLLEMRHLPTQAGDLQSSKTNLRRNQAEHIIIKIL